MSANVGSATGYLDLDISGFLAGLQSAQSAANTQTKNLATTIGNNISGIGSSLTSVGTTLTKFVTVPLIGVGTAGLKTAMSFEKGMSEVKAISGATGKEFEALREKAIDLGATTAFSAGEVAAAMTEMAKAGWSSQQVLDGMGGVLDAAAASGEALAVVSTIVADAITGFGMAASDSTRVADLLTQAANSGTIGITDLGESFKYIAPIAGAMGLNIEDVTTAIAAMSMAGIKGSSAGTALRTMLTNLVNPAGQAVKAIEELGISATNADGSMKSLDEIVSMLRTSFDDLTESEKSQYAAMLAGQEGMSGLLSLLNLTEEEYNAIAESMDNANGVAKETAEIMQDNLQSKVEQLGGSLESLAIKLGDILIPYIQQFVIWLTSLVDKFAALDTETQKSILKFAGIALAIGPALTVVGKLVTGIGGFITMLGKIPGAITKLKSGMILLGNGIKNIGEGFTLAKAGFSGLATSAGGFGTKIGVALAGITGPMIAVTAAVIALIAAFTSLWRNNEEFRNNIIAIWDQIKSAFDSFAQGFVDRLNSLGYEFESIAEVFGSVVGILKAIWQGFAEFLAPIFIGAFQQVQIALQAVLDVILGVVDLFIAVFTGNWQGAWNAIQNIFVSVWNGIVSTFQNVGNTLLNVLNVVLGWIGTSWQSAWSSVTSFLTSAWETIKNVVQVGVMFIGEILSAAFQIITLPFRFIWENCKETIMAAWEVIKTTVSNALTSISNTISNIWNAIVAFLSPILETIKTTMSNVWDAIKSITSSVWNSIKSAIEVPINAAKSVVNGVIDNIKSKFSSGLNEAKSTVSGIFDSIQEKISSIMDSAANTVKSGIDKLKSFFNFTWSLPKLKLPHFSISGSFSLNPPSVPSFSVSWYKKAMAGGMILNSPTIFGFDPSSGEFLGAGEAGSETIVGTASLMKMIRNAVNDAIRPMIEATYQLTKVSHELGYITNNAFARQTQVFEQIVKSRGSEGGGDTFNFYSPKPMDEIEAAKQMKIAKRDLAEGF